LEERSFQLGVLSLFSHPYFEQKLGFHGEQRNSEVVGPLAIDMSLESEEK
jgi:hypothetical protein